MKVIVDFSTEVFFRTARSGGKGGQHVNKVETMVEAYWAIAPSACFSPEEKERIFEKLKNRINAEGILIVKSDRARSQLANKKKALEKMLELVNQSILKSPKRIASKPSKAIIEKRLHSKRQQSEKKLRRKKDW